MNMSKRKAKTLTQTFTIPALLGGLSAAGLISGLVGDGVWDAVSWIGLGVPIAIIVRYVCAPKAP